MKPAPFFAAAIFAGLIGSAQAAPVSQFDRLKGVGDELSQVEKSQYVYGGRRYCFYPDGWRGPGFYWCGYRWRRGLGWGGPSGWRGWDGPGARIYVAPRGPRSGRDFDRGGSRFNRDVDRGGRQEFRGSGENRSGAGSGGPNRGDRGSGASEQRGPAPAAGGGGSGGRSGGDRSGEGRGGGGDRGNENRGGGTGGGFGGVPAR